MNYLKYLFIILAVTAQAQNYSYGLEEKKPKTVQEEIEPVSENLPEEQLYFDAYLLPVSRAYELQEVLDKYGSVRLEKGTYPGLEIELKENQSLFGHPSITKYNNKIRIKSGSKNIRVQNLNPNGIEFESGSSINNSFFKSISNTKFSCQNCIIENNSFINLDDCSVNFDCSDGGYLRNNRFIKLRSHTVSNQTVIKGNSSSPSYGNVVLWRNYLIPKGNTTEFSNLKTFTLVGFDAETWNFQNEGNRPLLFMRGMGNVKIASMSGLNHGRYPTPVFDIESENLFMLGKNIYSKSSYDIVREGSNVMMVSGENEDYNFVNNSSSTNFKAYFNNRDISLNGQTVASNLSNEVTNNLKSLLISEKAIPWERPNLPNLPILIKDMSTSSRSNRKDSSDEIQELIDKNNIAELEEGIYYISKSLIIKKNQGIIGKGSGKTAIVGMSDEFPLILAQDDVSRGDLSSLKYHLAHMTIQGGKTGLLVDPIGKEKNKLQLTSCTFKNLIFRNQSVGIHFNQFYGVDNNFFDSISFVDCEIGVLQEPDPSFDVSQGETTTMMYMDKNVFYNCQIIGSNVGFSMLALRPNNLNAWINSEFSENHISVDMTNQINAIFANCDFTGNKGPYIVGREKASSFYSCSFYNNNSPKIFELRKAYIEGSSFLDNLPLFNDLPSDVFLFNSTINGSLGSMSDGLLMNNYFKSESSLNKFLIDFDSKTPINLINQAVNANPQLLVTIKP